MRITIATLFILLIFSGSCLSQKLPKNHGNLETALFLTPKHSQSLVVAFGGSEGGNIFASEQTKTVRDGFLNRWISFPFYWLFWDKGDFPNT